MELILILLTIGAILIVVAYLHSPSVKGHISEQVVTQRINLQNLGYGGKILNNIYVPKKNGGTSEIDVLYITRKGLLVIENKNYVGYIFGNESNKNWTVTLYGGKNVFGFKKVDKFHFYNPIWQNKTHLKSLREYLGSDIKMFSVITFDNRGDLKHITNNSPDVFVCSHSGLSSIIHSIWKNYPDVLDDGQIDDIYSRLSALTNVDAEVKQQHIQSLCSKVDSIPVCPYCNGKLVIRTAHKGNNIGKQFYGCSNYPRCRYTRNL